MHFTSRQEAAVEAIFEAESEEKVSDLDVIDFYTEVEEPEVKLVVDKGPVETVYVSEEKISDVRKCCRAMQFSSV